MPPASLATDLAPHAASRIRLAPTTAAPALRRIALAALRLLTPIASILGLWYLAILFSGLPSFVLPRPERVLACLIADRRFIATQTLSTLEVSALGLLIANIAGIGLAILFDALPPARAVLMPAAITLRNMPYVALTTVLMLAIGDTISTKVTVVALAGFFPVLVNTMQGLRAADPVMLDRMHVLNAGWFETFRRVRLPYAVPAIISAQETAATGSIIVAISAEWMISSSGLGYVINRGMQTYRGDQVYAVALVATVLSFGIYSGVRRIGRHFDWRDHPRATR